jgi:hypothetical protein
VNDEAIVPGQVEDQVFASPPDTEYLLASDALLELGRSWSGDNVLPPYADAGEGAANERPSQAIDDGLDFG